LIIQFLKEILNLIFIDIMIEINRNDFILKADSIKNLIVQNFEKICVKYNETPLHKLIIYQLLRTEGAILIELRDFD